MRSTSSGKTVAAFSLAVDDGFGDKKKTIWVSCEAWEKTAEAVNRFLTKGKRATVVGRLTEDTWEANGEKKTKWKVVAERVEIIDFPDQNQQPAYASQDASDDDSIPF